MADFMNKLEDKVRNQVYNQVGILINQVSRQVWSQVNNQVWNQVNRQVWNRVSLRVRNQVINHMEKELDSR